MLKKIQKYQCSDGSLVDTVEEVKLKERNYFISQISQILKDDKLEVKAIILSMISDKILREHEIIHKLVKEFKSSMDLLEEDLHLSSLSKPIKEHHSTPITQVAPNLAATSHSNGNVHNSSGVFKEPLLKEGKEVHKDGFNTTYKDLKAIPADPLGGEHHSLDKVDIQLDE